MRIAFLVNRDVESNLALNLLLPRLHDQACGIFLSERVGGRKATPPAMLGQLGFIEQDLFNLLVFPMSAPASAGGSYAGFEALGERYAIPVHALPSVKDSPSLEMLQSVHADLFVSIRFGHILGAEALAIPPRGVLNLHSGLLPDYRGVLATLRALMNRDAEIGCTLHWIDNPTIDTGAVVATARVAVQRERSLFWHILALYPPGATLILDAIRRLERGEALEGRPQDPSSGAYYTFPTEADLVGFTAAGGRLFDRADLPPLLAAYGVVPPA